jgi:hypothetical protein
LGRPDEEIRSILCKTLRSPEIVAAVRRASHGLAADRRHWLRLLGNGVCPLAAANAFLSLWADLEQE